MARETPAGPGKPNKKPPFTVDRLEYEVAAELGLDPRLLKSGPGDKRVRPQEGPPRG